MATASEIAQTLAEGQAEAESLMLDTCRITKPGVGPKVFNETTGQYTVPAGVLVYEGKCRLQVKADINSNVVETTAGEREWTYLTAQLQLPVAGTEKVATDHIVEYLTAASDASLPGRLFNIAGPYHKSQAVYRRFRIREVAA